MHRVLVDEDLPRSLAPYLRSDGVDATDVRDVGLRSAPDDTVFAHNGLGGSSGWSLAGTVAIREPEKWPDTVFDVMDFYGKDKEKEIQKFPKLIFQDRDSALIKLAKTFRVSQTAMTYRLANLGF